MSDKLSNEENIKDLLKRIHAEIRINNRFLSLILENQKETLKVVKQKWPR